MISEWEIDRALYVLIGKIVDGSITPEERQTYHDLSVRRVRLMQFWRTPRRRR